LGRCRGGSGGRGSHRWRGLRGGRGRSDSPHWRGWRRHPRHRCHRLRARPPSWPRPHHCAPLRQRRGMFHGRRCRMPRTRSLGSRRRVGCFDCLRRRRRRWNCDLGCPRYGNCCRRYGRCRGRRLPGRRLPGLRRHFRGDGRKLSLGSLRHPHYNGAAQGPSHHQKRDLQRLHRSNLLKAN
jgi:hypothetical protein